MEGRKLWALGCEAWEVGGFVREDMGAVSSQHCSIECSLGTDTLFSLQANAALLWGALQGCCMSLDAQFI